MSVKGRASAEPPDERGGHQSPSHTQCSAKGVVTGPTLLLLPQAGWTQSGSAQGLAGMELPWSMSGLFWDGFRWDWVNSLGMGGFGLSQ